VSGVGRQADIEDMESHTIVGRESPKSAQDWSAGAVDGSCGLCHASTQQ
jgi:hypothetical protein